MKCIAYCRVSTQGQSDDGVSLDVQRTRAEAWAVANGHELVEVVVEVQSGGRAGNRPELARALAAVCKMKGVLVVYSLSRLARSVRDTLAVTEKLDRAKANLASITERIDTTSAMGRMVFHLMASLAAFEREQLAERTTAAMSHLRRGGRVISGRIPYGYDVSNDGTMLVEKSEEQEQISRMVEWRDTGASFAEIAQRLTEHRVACKTGGTVWSPTSVLSILTRRAKLARAA